MGTNTATVETLTAEVRVLMVGSRQITLSVARQLDKVDLLDMTTVFGRVRVGNLSTGFIEVGRGSWESALIDTWVIGSRYSSGALCLAPYVPSFARPLQDPVDVSTKVFACRKHFPRDASTYLTFVDHFAQRIRVPTHKVEWCNDDNHDKGGRCDEEWYPDDPSTLFDRVNRELYRRKVHADACNAPLIVLAGLR